MQFMCIKNFPYSNYACYFRTVALKTCFNISGTEKKGKHTINLHTKNDCVQISMGSEQEMNEWLKIINALAGQEEEEHHVEGKSHFEHVWMVQALNKGLGSKENIIGPYRLQLTSKELALYKFGEHDGRNDIVRFPVSLGFYSNYYDSQTHFLCFL